MLSSPLLKPLHEYVIADGDPGVGVMFIDLDNFKMVNDTYGHLMGDYVLKQVADILKMHEKKHIVSRMAGDEFLLFVPMVIRYLFFQNGHNLLFDNILVFLSLIHLGCL